MNKSIVLLAGLAALCATPAVAQTMSVPVSFAGLDLNSPAGMAVLNRRIDQAVRKICGVSDGRDLTASRMTMKCRDATTELTRPRIALAVASTRPSVRVAAK